MMMVMGMGSFRPAGYLFLPGFFAEQVDDGKYQFRKIREYE